MTPEAMKKKKVKVGKIARHKFRQKLGIKKGFGRPWSAPFVLFRVEFNWECPDGSEENEQVHWFECRKFAGEERKFLELHYNKSGEPWSKGETLESKFLCVYIAQFVVNNKEKMHVNQAFIYHSPKEGNDTIRVPIYMVKWTKELANNCIFDDGIGIVLQNAIWHRN